MISTAVSIRVFTAAAVTALTMVCVLQQNQLREQNTQIRHLSEKVAKIEMSGLDLVQMQRSMVVEQQSHHHNMDEKVDSMKEHIAEMNTQVSDLKHRQLQATPFDCSTEEGWCTATSETKFLFPDGGIIIGRRNYDCEYGKSILSVDGVNPFEAENCPSGKGSVTFGYASKALGVGSTVTAGMANIASGDYSSISGGSSNEASGEYSSVTGGERNKASGTLGSSVNGGIYNTASGKISNISGGYLNTSSGDYSSVSGGHKTLAEGQYSSISGGSENKAEGQYSSVSGGKKNIARGKLSSVLGTGRKTVSKLKGVFPKNL